MTDSTKYPFDYKVPHRCVYPVPDPSNVPNSGMSDCDEPAMYYGWWDDYDDGWWLCHEHLYFILECEKNDRQR